MVLRILEKIFHFFYRKAFVDSKNRRTFAPRKTKRKVLIESRNNPNGPFV